MAFLEISDGEAVESWAENRTLRDTQANYLIDLAFALMNEHTERRGSVLQ